MGGFNPLGVTNEGMADGDATGDALGGALQSAIDQVKLLQLSEDGSDGEESEEKDKKQEDFVRLLFKRIAQAKKPKEKWEKAYEVDRSHDYVRGFQRSMEDEKDAQGDRKYQLNRILAAMKTKIPRMFYYAPYARVRAARGREDTPQSNLATRASLLQDTLNSIIRQKNTRFKAETMLALKEAQWAFGLIEIGYEAEWGENPYSKKPTLVENDEARDDLEAFGKIGPEPEEDEEITQALSTLKEVPQTETFYVKHIPARQFYASSNDRSSTEAMDWVGYWEWMYVEDIKRSPSFKNTKDLKATAKAAEGSGVDKEFSPIGNSDKSEEVPPDMVRVWKVWDQRDMVRYVIAEGHDKILKETQYVYLPLFPLRLEVMPGEWYPIPPVFSQLVEQDEFNDAREWLRLVRKGTRPRYTYDKAAFPDTELEKLETDEFGTFIGVDNQNMNAIQPVQQPTFSEATVRTLALSEQGFAEASASSATARLTRGAGGKPTAKEVGSLEESGDIRDSYEQQELAEWMGLICYGLIECAVEKMTLPQWVLINTDPRSPVFQMEAQVIAQTYQEITSDMLAEAHGGAQWDVTVDVESLSPVSESQHAARIMQALQMLSASPVGMLLSLAPPLLKTMLNLMGIRAASDQESIFAALQAKQQMEQQMAMMGGGGPPGVAPSAGAPSPRPGGAGGNPEPPAGEKASAPPGNPGPPPQGPAR
jgi:hypothetical protein